MVLLDIGIQSRVIIGISAMVVLFTSFLIVFISNQRKKLQYHKDLQAMHEERQQLLSEQNMLLEQRVKERTAELFEQKETLQKALQELKAAQSHLVQKEKMASLGELTAGVAHEIQNPLNFVFNFTKINVDLLMEIRELMASETLSNGFSDDFNSLINDITDNSNKILRHSERADGIVKNMLQHSRVQSGAMALTDLNELAEEYLKLSYNGFRAKHKSFHCNFQKSYDEHIGPINLRPQDIGHTLANLFNNSFFSMNEKMKLNRDHYEPALTIHTEKKGNRTMIGIRDNGLGISPGIMHKIYQPFFTTKPTGQAVGLGLSLCYDIVKAHQGELKAESTEGEFAAFTIELDGQ